jgi:murein DD-endopeptidase MepM/ murein hydrolase activator NlpD
MGLMKPSSPSRALLILLCTLAAAAPGGATGAVPAAADGQPVEARPFSLPFREPPGPSTWYLVQLYGNTLNAFYVRHTTYAAGQGLHFGVDFAAPCGTPVVAIGDGVVAKVDPPEHRAYPHSLMIDHSSGYASFYGHLLERPALVRGQAVVRGQVIALSGDSSGSCTSAPHLHLEIRDRSYRVAYNPVALIEADWDDIALASRGPLLFARDLGEPRRWQHPDDQPEIQMGGPLLNDYADVWPPDWR